MGVGFAALRPPQRGLATLVCYKCRVQPPPVATPPVAFHRPQIGAAERAAADRVLASGALVQGSEVEQLEQEMAATVGGRACVAVSSGSAALHLGLVAAGVGRGDEVIVPSFTFAATAHAVAQVGAVPVFADIDPDTYCIDPAAVSAAITPRTAAVIPVHLYGHPADMAAIDQIGASHGLLVLEDGCQAQGATLAGRPVGTLAPIAAISFYPTKTMTTIEGGMLICDSAAIAARVRSLRNQGLELDGSVVSVGYNARMTDVAAAVGRVQLERVPEFLASRRANAARWDAALSAELLPSRRPDVAPAHSVYTIRPVDRVQAAEVLAARGIETRVYYDTPLHLSPAYRSASGQTLPQTEAAASSVLSVPVGPHLTASDAERVVDALGAL